MFKKLAAIVALLFALMITAPVAAHAADDHTCAEGEVPNGNTDPNAPYCTPNTPNVGPQDDATVLPSEHEQGGGSTGAPTVVETDAAPVTPAAATAPSGSLPFTGGDVIGMTVIGAGAVALGSILVLRSKRSAGSAA